MLFKKRTITILELDNLGCQLFYSILVFQIGMATLLFFLCPPVSIAKNFTLVFVVLAILIGFFCQQQRDQAKREHEEDKLIIQLRSGYRLITVTDCIFREICDHLQVISMMAILGKVEAIDIYIANLVNEMHLLKNPGGIENPVIASVILYHIIIAREKGIDLVIFSNTTLNDCTSHLDLLEQIFDLSLKILVENEITSRSESKLILIDISETVDSYVLFFSVSEEATQILRSWESPGLTALEFRRDLAEKYKLVDRLIDKMGASYTSKAYGNFTGELAIRLQK
jgi:hypothetical protein